MSQKVTIFNRSFNYYKKYGITLFLSRLVLQLLFYWIRYTNNRIIRLLKKHNILSIIKEINGYKMHLDFNKDDGLSRFLTITNIREKYILKSLMNELKDCNVVVDIGANVGYYALLESKLMGEKGIVYAIEPVPETCKILEENVNLNGFKNIEIYKLAIGNEDGFASMYVGEWLNRSQMKEVHNINKELISQEINVKLTTLDNFLRNKIKPNLLRMDVEGYEYNIIKGMVETIKDETFSTICMEFHFRWLGERKSIFILKTLKKQGFEIFYATLEVDEKCTTRNETIENISSYLNSKCSMLPPKGYLNLSIDKIIENEEMQGMNIGSLDFCMLLGAVEIIFKKLETQVSHPK